MDLVYLFKRNLPFKQNNPHHRTEYIINEGHVHYNNNLKRYYAKFLIYA